MMDFETQPGWTDMADCPFCKARASEFLITVSYSTTLQSSDPKYFMGECSECGAQGPTADTEQEAFARWNGWIK